MPLEFHENLLAGFAADQSRQVCRLHWRPAIPCDARSPVSSKGGKCDSLRPRGVIEGVGVADNADVLQSVEKHQRPELSRFFDGGFGQLIPERASGDSFKAGTGVLKHSPDETGTVISTVVSPEKAIPDSQSSVDRLIQHRRSFIREDQRRKDH